MILYLESSHPRCHGTRIVAARTPLMLRFHFHHELRRACAVQRPRPVTAVPPGVPTSETLETRQIWRRGNGARGGFHTICAHELRLCGDPETRLPFLRRRSLEFEGPLL
jgi:hypothetical protein